MKPLYTKGTVVVCPGCNEDILEFAEDVHSGQPLLATQVKSLIPEYTVNEGDPTFCFLCGEKYFDGSFMFHVRGVKNEVY